MLVSWVFHTIHRFHENFRSAVEWGFLALIRVAGTTPSSWPKGRLTLPLGRGYNHQACARVRPGAPNGGTRSEAYVPAEQPEAREDAWLP